MSGNNVFLNEARILEKKWEQTGLLSGISDAYTRKVTSVVLENQRLALQKLNESGTDSSDVANFQRISIPLVRRIYPQLIANKIVSIQPLLGPAGLVYYMRFRYSSNKGAMRGGSNAGYPSDDAQSLMQKANGDVNLDTTYTSQEVSNEVSTTDDGNDVSSVYGALEHTPVIPGTVTGTIYDGTTIVQTFTVTQAGAFQFSDVGSPSIKVTAGSLDVTTGALELTWNSAPGANHVVVSYEYNMEGNQDMPEINLVIESDTITAKTRRLKASWTFEAQQDIRSQHSLDAEAELTQVMAQEINLEIDREILNDLRTNAGTVAAWDYNAALGDNIKEKYESLFVKITEVSNVVHRKTLRGSANWIVTSPEIASIFETATAGFAPSSTESFTSSLGVQYVGSVNQKWKLYKDPNFQNNQILMGYKGESYMDSGYFFCPYVPLTQTPVVMDPESMTPRKGLMTRYGKKLLREGAKFFARVSIANFVI
jgi:hypothetical protein